MDGRTPGICRSQVGKVARCFSSHIQWEGLSLHFSIAPIPLVPYRGLVTSDIPSHLISQFSKDRQNRHYYH